MAIGVLYIVLNIVIEHKNKNGNNNNNKQTPNREIIDVEYKEL